MPDVYPERFCIRCQYLQPQLSCDMLRSIPEPLKDSGSPTNFHYMLQEKRSMLLSWKHISQLKQHAFVSIEFLASRPHSTLNSTVLELPWNTLQVTSLWRFIQPSRIHLMTISSSNASCTIAVPRLLRCLRTGEGTLGEHYVGKIVWPNVPVDSDSNVQCLSCPSVMPQVVHQQECHEFGGSHQSKTYKTGVPPWYVLSTRRKSTKTTSGRPKAWSHCKQKLTMFWNKNMNRGGLEGLWEKAEVWIPDLIPKVLKCGKFNGLKNG